jgi:hypothetical protein
VIASVLQCCALLGEIRSAFVGLVNLFTVERESKCERERMLSEPILNFVRKLCLLNDVRLNSQTMFF